MKKIFALAFVAAALTACSETTTVSSAEPELYCEYTAYGWGNIYEIKVCTKTMLLDSITEGYNNYKYGFFDRDCNEYSVSDTSAAYLIENEFKLYCGE